MGRSGFRTTALGCVAFGAWAAVVHAADEAPSPPPQSTAHDDGSRTADNVVFFELLGNAGLYSLNYERLLGDSGFGLRAGVSIGWETATATGAGDSTTHVFAIVPIVASYYVGSADHKLQLGAGGVIVTVPRSSDFPTPIVGTAVVAYRYLPHDGGFQFGIGVTPFVGRFVSGHTFALWGGLSLGHVF